MPTTPHIEKHFTASKTVRDVVIGMADGLTVPFALAAGIAGAVANNDLIVTAGLAEIAAGSIAMGLGGYLAARTDAQHYQAELAREYYEVDHLPEVEKKEVSEIFESYGLEKSDAKLVVEALSKNRDRWVDFMMRFELGLEKPEPKRALQSAATIGGAYLIGGLIPLASYMLTDNVERALSASIAVTLTTLLIFGAI
ncbi:MAG: VIT1/CCC1 transporter family protein, partial [Dongiaceae bacterium]